MRLKASADAGKNRPTYELTMNKSFQIGSGTPCDQSVMQAIAERINKLKREG